MHKYGFKEITQENWLEPDKVSISFVHITPDGELHPTEGSDWLQYILDPTLSKAVPSDVRKLYEVARGALVYGYFFYPLYTLASEQLFRVVEAAVVHKCFQKGAPQGKMTFGQGLNYLLQVNALTKKEKPDWLRLKELRDWASHPQSQTILPPGMAIGMLEQIAERINSLFVEDKAVK